LGSPDAVNGVITQGRGTDSQFVTSYKISYGNVTNPSQMIQYENGTDQVKLS